MAKTSKRALPSATSAPTIQPKRKADTSNDRKTIRDLSPEAQSSIKVAASRAGMTQGKWLTLAATNQIKADSESSRALVRMDQPGLPAVRQTPDSVPIAALMPRQDQVSELEMIERICAVITALSGTGRDIPKSIENTAFSLIRVRLINLKRQTNPDQRQTSAPKSPPK